MDPALLVARPRQEVAKDEVQTVSASAREVRLASRRQKMVPCGECGVWWWPTGSPAPLAGRHLPAGGGTEDRRGAGRLASGRGRAD